MEKQSFDTRIVVLKDNGQYFNGVKGKVPRFTKNFKDAKVIDKMNDRDRRYLEKYSYDIINVRYTIVKLEV